MANRRGNVLRSNECLSPGAPLSPPVPLSLPVLLSHSKPTRVSHIRPFLTQSHMVPNRSPICASWFLGTMSSSLGFTQLKSHPLSRTSAHGADRKEPLSLILERSWKAGDGRPLCSRKEAPSLGDGESVRSALYMASPCNVTVTVMRTTSVCRISVSNLPL